jgi:small subunit ribosomal protein S20
MRKVREAIANMDAEKSQAEFLILVKKIDRAATANLLHANAAARTKSRLSKAIKAIAATK